MHTRIILASQSPRRKEFLDGLCLQYEVIASNIEEVAPDEITESHNACQIAIELAHQKAFAVGEKLCQNANGVNELVIIGADTIVVLDNKLFGKPNTPDEARETLQALCGKTHNVYTGLALLVYNLTNGTMQCFTESENTSVTFRQYNDIEIEAYIKTCEPMDKAGAYALQGIGSCFVEKIDGCYSNVIGLPMPKLVKMLRQAGVPILGQ